MNLADKYKQQHNAMRSTLYSAGCLSSGLTCQLHNLPWFPSASQAVGGWMRSNKRAAFCLNFFVVSRHTRWLTKKGDRKKWTMVKYEVEITENVEPLGQVQLWVSWLAPSLPYMEQCLKPDLNSIIAYVATDCCFYRALWKAFGSFITIIC